jgi:hypothetical protein
LKAGTVTLPDAGRSAGLLAALTLVVGAGCASSPADLARLEEVPEVAAYCLAAQRLMARTEARVELVVHDSFEAFVKSKAIMDGPNGPQIQQFNWFDAAGAVTGISCKLKSAEHLNLEFGQGTAAGEGACQEMNREVFRLVSRWVREPKFTQVSFDAAETVENKEQPGMTGPDWLAPYTMTYTDDAGGLHIRSKGFVVEFTDPRYARAPERFRGVHYCHFIAPAHLAAVLQGAAPAGAVVGRAVDTSGPPPESDNG